MSTETQEKVRTEIKIVGYANACVVWCPKCTPKRLIASGEFLPVGEEMAGEECDKCGKEMQG